MKKEVLFEKNDGDDGDDGGGEEVIVVEETQRADLDPVLKAREMSRLGLFMPKHCV